MRTNGPAPIAIAGAAGGALISAYGNYEAGQANKQQAQYQAGVASLNQTIAEQNAAYARYAGEVEAQTEGMKVRSQIAQTRAEQGAGGLDVSSGSNALVQKSEYDIGQQDIATIRSNAAKRAYGYQVAGVQYEAESTLDKYKGDQAETAGDINALASLIGGAGSVSSKWMNASSPLKVG